MATPGVERSGQPICLIRAFRYRPEASVWEVPVRGYGNPAG
ncbi:MAG: hypothetical protein AB7I30_09835 [Isosphaeraceae bacterium]